jgi:hypothetical protein
MTPRRFFLYAWLETPEHRAFVWYSICTLQFLYLLGRVFHSNIVNLLPAPPLHQTPIAFFNQATLLNLAYFVVSVAMIFGIFALSRLSRAVRWLQVFMWPGARAPLAGVLAANVVLCLYRPSTYMLAAQPALMLLPYYIMRWRVTRPGEQASGAWSGLAWFVLALIGVVVFFMYADLVFRKPMLYNDFFRIPEQYRISGESGFENTTDIINGNGYMGTHQKIDVDNAEAWKTNAACTAVAEGDPAITALVAEYAEMNKETYNARWNIWQRSVFYPVLEYVEDRLCVIPADGPASDLPAVYAVNAHLAARLESMRIAPPSSLQEAWPRNGMTTVKASHSSYLNDSSAENFFQAHLRGQFKHQEHYLLPAHEYMLGKALDKITHQYGLALTVVPAAFCKWLGGGTLDYGVLLRVLHSFWYVDFLIVCLCLWAIFGDMRRALPFIGALALGRLFFGYFFTLTSAGGHEIFRGICFAPALYFLFRYSNEPRLRWLTGLLASFTLGMFFNVEFGVFLPLAFVGVLAAQGFMAGKITRSTFIALFCSAAVLIGGIYLFGIGEKDAAKYFLRGLSSAPYVSLRKISVLLLIFVAHISAFIHMTREKSAYSAIFLFSALYSQMLMTYYVRGGAIDFLTMFFFQHATPFLIFTVFLLEKCRAAYIKTAVNAIYMLTLLAVPMQTFFFFKEKAAYTAVIDSHKVYDWNFDKAKLRSTIDPDYIQNALELIKKFAPGRETDRNIAIISQYDALLTFLADKLSILPHYDLINFLVSQRESDLAEERLRNGPPPPSSFSSIPISKRRTAWIFCHCAGARSSFISSRGCG